MESDRACYRRLLPLVALTLALMSASVGSVVAQEDAGIIGQVTDESGAVLPGVTITAASPALQVQSVSAVTDERGEYRLTPLPIGTYSVEYTLTGFQTVRREGLRLTVGFVAKLDVSLKVGALEETVTVSGQSPVVDVMSTSAPTRLTKENLELIPSSRNGVIGLMAQAPGVRTNLDVGGSSITSVPTFRAFGQNNEPWQQIEGVVTSTPKSGTQGGHYWDYSSFEEAKVQTFGSSAEFPTRGIQVNGILKSGGNDFHGSGFFGKTNRHLQSDNIDSALAAQGITRGNPIETRSDLSGEFGGRIVRDKLWFYYSARRRQEIDDVLQCFQPDGSTCTESQLQGFSTEKFSYQLSASNRLTGFHQWSLKNTVSGTSRLVAWESRANQVLNSNVYKAEWQRAKGSVLTSLQFGSLAWSTHFTGYAPDKVSATDLVTGVTTGQSVSHAQSPVEYRHQPKFTLSWFKPDLFLGNHDFRTGTGYMWSRSDRPWISRGPSGNYQLQFRSTAPFQIATYNYPVTPIDLLHYFDFFVQDGWTMGRRLTLNVGLRYARDNAFAPEQCRVDADPPSNMAAPAQCFPRVQFKIWNVVVPRLHAAYDVLGDGKTVIKGGWGRFAYMRYVDVIQQANRNVATTTIYRWSDPNRNGAYDPGEVDLSLNGRDFVSTTLQGVGAALANGIPNPNEKEPMTDEFSLSVERELAPNVALRFTGLYSRTLNTYRLRNNLRPYDVYNIPITNADPGPDGRVGSADDPGTFITYYDYPSAYAGQAFQQPMLINDPRANSTYKSFEIAASRRLANRWQFNASYSATKKHIPLVPNVGTPSGLTIYVNTFDPNAEIFNSDNTWEWLGRASGSYMFPGDVLASGNFEHRSGNPQARQVLFTGGRQISSITLNVEPVGTSRLPNINLLDFSVEKAFRLVRAHRATMRLNLYNALNTNAVTSVRTVSGATYGLATGIVLPRILELNVSYRF